MIDLLLLIKFINDLNYKNNILFFILYLYIQIWNNILEI